MACEMAKYLESTFKLPKYSLFDPILMPECWELSLESSHVWQFWLRLKTYFFQNHSENKKFEDLNLQKKKKKVKHLWAYPNLKLCYQDSYILQADLWDYSLK